MTLISIIKNILQIVGDLCLLFISAYTFRLTILPKKLRFIGYRPSFSTFEGDSLEITLENRSLAPVVIQSISLVLNGYSIKIFSEDDNECETCIIDGFKTGKIKMRPFSEIYTNEGNPDFHKVDGMYLIVETPRGNQYLTFANSPNKGFSKLNKKSYTVQDALVTRNFLDNQIIKPYIRYAIVFFDKNDNLQTILVHKAGLMSKALFGHNHLPKETLLNKETLYTHFKEQFSKANISFNIIELNDDKGNSITKQEI